MSISLMYNEHFGILFFTGVLREKWQKGRILLIVMRKIKKNTLLLEEIQQNQNRMEGKLSNN